MTQKSLEKNKVVLKELEKKISPVLVVNNSSLKPYVELFEYSPENIYQQPLGSLVGFFEIKEYSDDSAYIVNFLTSVLKKEYYINPKRPVSESLDSALHKINMALSELVKHGNMEWLGKLNAAICVLEKNSAHFSVAGSAKIFLYRNTILSEISKDLASDSPEPHPLKTFVNVSSGRLEKDDRMLITPEDIFHILTADDLRKNFQRLEGEKLVQFLKTALSNQLEMISAIVIEMIESEPAPEIKITNNQEEILEAANVFSEKTFANAGAKATSEKQKTEPQQEIENEASEYTDKKTGHIYVQGEEDGSSEGGQAHLYWDITKEKIAQVWYVSKNNLRRSLSLYKKRLAKKRELVRAEKEKQKQIAIEEKQKIKEQKIIEKKRQKEQIANQKKEREQAIAEEKELEKQRQLKRGEISEITQSTDKNPQQKEKIAEKNIAESIQNQKSDSSFKKKLQRAIAEQKQNAIVDLRSIEKSKNLETKEFDSEETIAFENHNKNSAEKNQRSEEIRKIFGEIFLEIRNMPHDIFAVAKLVTKKIIEKTKKMESDFDLDLKPDASIGLKKESHLIPHFHKIKRLFASFSYTQRLYVLSAILLIFIAPFFINRWMNRPKPQTITELPSVLPAISETLANEKNINLAPEKRTILSKNNITGVLAINSDAVIITKKSVIVINSEKQQKEYPLPDNSGIPIRTTFMKDLSLIFILTDQSKLVSFSPVSSKFAENSINFPEKNSALLIGTFMTYMYVLDPQSNQIYRYPRTTGGFGEKTSWLKEQTSLAQISDMTIDDNIYCIQNKKVIKFFKGKVQQFALETSSTPISFDKIFTNIDSEFLYALDTKNSRIVKFNKTDGSIVKQYFDEALSGGTYFSIDEANKVAYISTSSELISISIQ